MSEPSSFLADCRIDVAVSFQDRWRRGWQVAYWRQPLDATSAEFAAAGFLIERVHEPRPTAEMHERYPEAAAWLSVNPGFVVFSLVKR